MVHRSARQPARSGPCGSLVHHRARRGRWHQHLRAAGDLRLRRRDAPQPARVPLRYLPRSRPCKARRRRGMGPARGTHRHLDPRLRGLRPAGRYPFGTRPRLRGSFAGTGLLRNLRPLQGGRAARPHHRPAPQRPLGDPGTSGNARQPLRDRCRAGTVRGRGREGRLLHCGRCTAGAGYLD